LEAETCRGNLVSTTKKLLKTPLSVCWTSFTSPKVSLLLLPYSAIRLLPSLPILKPSAWHSQARFLTDFTWRRVLRNFPPICHVCYASDVWNYIKSKDVQKLERIQRELVALFQYRFFTYDLVAYEDFLKFLKFHTLYNRTVHYYALCFMPVYSGSKCCPSLFDIAGNRVHPL
jgi:hypothetical protein